MSKLTRWFGGKHKPGRPGVYQRKMMMVDWLYAEWTGYQWLRAAGTIDGATRMREVSNIQFLPWRGLKSKSGVGEKG